jgi:hypothetical protein
MTALSFPASPTESQTYTAGSRAWTYTAGAWVPASATPGLSFSATAGEALAACTPVAISTTGKAERVRGFPADPRGWGPVAGMVTTNSDCARSITDEARGLQYFITSINNGAWFAAADISSGEARFGPAVYVGSGHGYDVALLDTGKAIVVYRGNNATAVYARVVTIGTDLVATLGTAVDIASNAAYSGNANSACTIAAKPGTNLATVFYPNGSNVIVGRSLSISGTTITAGTSTTTSFNDCRYYWARYCAAADIILFVSSTANAGTAVTSTTMKACTVSIGATPAFSAQLALPTLNGYYPAINDWQSRTSMTLSLEPGGSRFALGCSVETDGTNHYGYPAIYVGRVTAGGVSAGAPQLMMPEVAAHTTYESHGVALAWDGPGDTLVGVWSDRLNSNRPWYSKIGITDLEVTSRQAARLLDDSTQAYYFHAHSTPYGALVEMTHAAKGQILWSWTSKATNARSFVGFTRAAAAKDATVEIALGGTTLAGFTGLTPGTRYYLRAGGTISPTPDASNVFAGTALTSTTLLIGR